MGLQVLRQAHAVAAQHANNARALQEPMINAENEFNRIIQLLSVPMISLATPGATMAKIPATANANAMSRPSLAAYDVTTSPYGGGSASGTLAYRGAMGSSPVSSPVRATPTSPR